MVRKQGKGPLKKRGDELLVRGKFSFRFLNKSIFGFQEREKKDLGDTLKEQVGDSPVDLCSALMGLAQIKLSEKRLLILKGVYELADGKITITRLCRELSHKLKMPSSTLRWNLKKLRKAGLIESGTKDDKGKPIKVTEIGKIILETYFNNALMQNRF